MAYRAVARRANAGQGGRTCTCGLPAPNRFGDLVVGTNGRGIWIMDDISPLREYGKGGVFLKPRPAYRFKPRQAIDTAPGAIGGGRGGAGQGGAGLNFYLAEAAPGGAVIKIFDESGAKWRTLRAPAAKGLNRAAWNLRGEPVPQLELRTTPDFHPHVWEEKRFRGRDTRPVSHWGMQQPLVGVLAPPGIYTVRLTVAIQQFNSKSALHKATETVCMSNNGKRVAWVTSQ